MKRGFCVAAVLLMVCLAVFAADWPQFRGESASGVGVGTNPPVKWDAVNVFGLG